MLNSIARILLILVFTCIVGNSILAQAQKLSNQQGGEDLKAQLEELFSSAKESVISENGRVTFLRLQIPKVGEKQFSFVHHENGRSFTMNDESGVALKVTLFKDGRIESVEMPNGQKMQIQWKQNEFGDWFPETISCNSKSVSTNLIEMEVGNPCRDAAAATVIAIGICAATGASTACWAATANAAYHTYRCYEATRGQTEARFVDNLPGFVPTEPKLSFGLAPRYALKGDPEKESL